MSKKPAVSISAAEGAAPVAPTTPAKAPKPVVLNGHTLAGELRGGEFTHVALSSLSCFKSTLCAFLAEFLDAAGHDVVCYDMDPGNHTLARRTGLSVEVFETLAQSDSTTGESSGIDQSLMDPVIQQILEQDGDAVVDPGAASFFAFAQYLMRSRVSEMLMAFGKPMVAHVPIIGGPRQDDTVQRLVDLGAQLSEVPIVVWVCDKDGRPDFGGKALTETQAFQSVADHVEGVVHIPRLNELELPPFLDMLERGETLAQAQARWFDGFERDGKRVRDIMKAQRLLFFRRRLWQQLNLIFGEDVQVADLRPGKKGAA